MAELSKYEVAYIIPVIEGEISRAQEAIKDQNNRLATKMYNGHIDWLQGIIDKLKM